MRLATYRRRLITLWGNVAVRATVLATLINVGLVFAIYAPDHSANDHTASDSKENRVGPAIGAESPEERTANYTFWLTAYTLVLAVSTVGLWIVTWRAARGQSRDMQKSIRHAEAASKAAAESNQLSRELFVAEQRPWMQVQVSVAELPIVMDDKLISISLQITTGNIGRSPAFEAAHGSSSTFHVGYEGFDDFFDGIRSFAEEHTYSKGWTIFPGENSSWRSTISIRVEDVVNYDVYIRGVMEFYYAISCKYRLSVGGDVHETSRLYVFQVTGITALANDRQDVFTEVAHFRLFKEYVT